MTKDIKTLLDTEAARINTPEFIPADPVQFPRRFERLQDIEIVAILAASIAWGNRKMICRDAEKLLRLMDYDPFSYVMEKGYEDLDPELNIHRTLFASHLQHQLRGFRQIYQKYGSLEEFCRQCGASESEFPSWKLVEEIQNVTTAANGGVGCNRCLPLNMKTTALKRVNMALRWLVRDDGIVDMGVWKALKPSQLFIPLDVHVGNTARRLGLLTRKADDRRSTVELTGCLRELRPEDPVYYDYALFGIDME